MQYHALLSTLLTLFSFLAFTNAWTLKAWDGPNYTGELLINASGATTTNNKCYNLDQNDMNRITSYKWDSGNVGGYCYFAIYDKTNCSGNPFVRIWRSQSWSRSQLTSGWDNKAGSYYVDCVPNYG